MALAHPKTSEKRGLCNVVQGWEESGADLIDKVLNYSSKGSMRLIYGPVQGYWQEINNLMQHI